VNLAEFCRDKRRELRLFARARGLRAVPMQLGEGNVGTLHHREAIGRRAKRLLVAGTVSATIAWPAGQASAQGLFDVLFGWLSPPQQPQGRTPGGSGRPAAFCVRLCDGRYFPVHHHNAATPVQLCSALCPASKTMVFWGNEIEHASAQDGSRYRELDNAYLYREKMVPNCTCNGKDAFGLAPVDPNSDPTLRPGDVVATRGGLMAYTGSRPNGGASEFTPVNIKAMEGRRRVSGSAPAVRWERPGVTPPDTRQPLRRATARW
jgi:hypothetical protein